MARRDGEMDYPPATFAVLHRLKKRISAYAALACSQPIYGFARSITTRLRNKVWFNRIIGSARIWRYLNTAAACLRQRYIFEDVF